MVYVFIVINFVMKNLQNELMHSSDRCPRHLLFLLSSHDWLPCHSLASVFLNGSSSCLLRQLKRRPSPLVTFLICWPLRFFSSFLLKTLQKISSFSSGTQSAAGWLLHHFRSPLLAQKEVPLHRGYFVSSTQVL